VEVVKEKKKKRIRGRISQLKKPNAVARQCFKLALSLVKERVSF
jgi:hypothetical protein